MTKTTIHYNSFILVLLNELLGTYYFFQAVILGILGAGSTVTAMRTSVSNIITFILTLDNIYPTAGITIMNHFSDDHMAAHHSGVIYPVYLIHHNVQLLGSWNIWSQHPNLQPLYQPRINMQVFMVSFICQVGVKKLPAFNFC